jgi:hypothetical protein
MLRGLRRRPGLVQVGGDGGGVQAFVAGADAQIADRLLLGELTGGQAEARIPSAQQRARSPSGFHQRLLHGHQGGANPRGGALGLLIQQVAQPL